MSRNTLARLRFEMKKKPGNEDCRVLFDGSWTWVMRDGICSFIFYLIGYNRGTFETVIRRARAFFSVSSRFTIGLYLASQGAM